jgi:Mg2+ and Co2+ transporter CorA
MISQLLNATTLREASRANTMNRYIVVFTIVTVMYLPPNFIGVRQARA